MMSQISALSELGIAVDPELAKVVEIAGHIGEMTGDEVNVSYTSLLIGLLWSDDRTSQWLQAEPQQRRMRLDAIYANRNHPERQRDAIMARVTTGAPFTPRTDVLSVSARTVLQEANSIANETSQLPNTPVGTRHLAAAYFFRNPPGHDHQLHVEWGFETDAWRRAFAEFIRQQYGPEATRWSALVSGYIPDEPAQTTLPGTVLGTYEFEPPAVAVLRTVEVRAELSAPQALTSELLLRTLAAIRSEPDCASFAEQVAPRLLITTGIPLNLNVGPFDTSGSALPASRGFKNILDRARTLTRSTTSTELIGVRHIIASLLVAPDSTANKLLVDAGVSIPLLRQNLLRDFSRRWVNDDGVQWRFHLIGQTPPTIAGFNADDADKGDDKLDVARYATAFAVVLAADAVTPPLSIGIFGDWGSGKSFFMRLMQEQTRRVTASTAADASGQRLFCRHVVPIRFNAWHYADRNLWATMVQTIFESLRAAMVGTDGESDLMDRVIASLEVTKVARKEAEERVVQARNAEKASADALARTRAELAAKAKEIDTVRTTDVLAVLRQTVITDARLDKAATVAETYLGITGVETIVRKEKKTNGEVMDLVNESQIVAARSHSALDWLVRAPVQGPELTALAVCTLLVVLVGGYAGIRYRHEISAAWPLVSSAFIEGASVVALGTAWARRHLSTVARGLDQFDTVRAQLDAKVASQRALANEGLAKAENAHAAALNAVTMAQADLDAAHEAVRKAERDVQESRSAHRIAQLVEQRITGRDYSKYLGVVDAIRRDFQTLTTLMKQLRKERAAGQDDGSLPIDRIVLYIDDLDRCPSDKVVSVLEAIHLLLAFELFVVVVGVDVRWAARSLAERYPRHLATGKYEGTEGQAGIEEGASALDYLEKIFQIPFWLPPMDDQASRNMIADLVPRPKSESRPVKPLPPASSGIQPPPPPKDEPDTARPSSVTSSTTFASGKAEPLLIEPEERSFMLSLAEAVGKSPRRLKRFVNTYRIFKGSIDALSRETFVLDGGRAGQYRAAMTLLALITGAPRSSLALFQQLADEGDDVAIDDQFTSRVVDGLSAKEEKGYVRSALRAYRTAAPEGTTLTVRELRHWMPDVSRFSFRSGRW